MTHEYKNKITEIQNAIQDKVNQNISLTNEINKTEAENAKKDKKLHEKYQDIVGLKDDLDQMNADLK
jgi:uncharacterized coiled-coil DUF342 family protein